MQRSATTVAIGGLSIAVVVLLIVRGRRDEPRAPAPSPTFSLPAPSAAVPLPALSDGLAPLALPAPPSSRPLPAGSPRALRFGVVLFQYRGAQIVHDIARTREEALALARVAAELGRRDFKAAVKTGDPGSTEDAGRMTRGILEPGVEYDLFTVPLGSVSEPIDTPRGFWVAKRLE